MARKFTRRHLLKFAGGSAAGVLLTPMPWKMLDDLAIWTQNGPWIPKPPRGEITTRFTGCTLCPAGCGVRARCVGSQPVSLSGVAAHPVSRGALCPVGLGGHHISYHPARLLQAVQLKRGGPELETVPVSQDAAVNAIVRAARETMSAGSTGNIAILDQIPGRTISRIYRKFLGSTGRGVYLTGEYEQGGSVALARMLAEPWGEPGLDLGNASTLLSFGAPVLDGWGTPGRMAEIAAIDDDGRRKLRIIQVEPRRSRTASAADLWLPIRPGTEAALAFGLAQVLLREKLVDERTIRSAAADFDLYTILLEKFAPEIVSRLTGIEAERTTALARELARAQAAIVIGGGDPGGGPLGEEEETAISGLNLLLGTVGRRGGIVARRQVPQDPNLSGNGLAEAVRIADVPDGSIRLLIIDPARSGSAIPWKLLEKKLTAENALVVAISPVLAGDALRAHLAIPAPAYLEALEEVPSPVDSAVATFSVSQPLHAAPASVLEPAQLIGELASALSLPLISGESRFSLQASLKRKAEAIHKTGRGTVFSPADGKTTDLAAIDSAEAFWKLLLDGACWCDAAQEPETPPRYSLMGAGKNRLEALATAGEGRLGEAGEAAAYPLVLMPFGLRGALDDAHVSPLMTKLYQESGLRRLNNQADINPATAVALGLSNRSRALVETPSGAVRVEIRFDAGVMPGVIHVALGPSGSTNESGEARDRRCVLEICPSGPVWRVSRANVREA
jgi:menaquinone reductase, molybdopterin-binding-like subunit